MQIRNYLRINDRIDTSGQPRAGDFPDMAGQGFRSVINLALPGSDNALAEEGSIVTGLGMNYFHIPVVWEAPRVDQFRTFAGIMEGHEHEKIWVHCALNMRVSCFMYLYHTLVRGMPELQARALMNRIWNPDEYPVWKKFIDDVRAAS
jgi:protein tyrosine phosphatase (PTP) superfamily phosphohydrolase (DUF442 family)